MTSIMDGPQKNWPHKGPDPLPDSKVELSCTQSCIISVFQKEIMEPTLATKNQICEA